MSHTESSDSIANSLIITTFSVNATTLYTLENTAIINKFHLQDLHDIISNQTGIINNITSSNIGTIPIFLNDQNLTLYYLKQYLDSDLVTIITVFDTNKVSLILPITVLDELFKGYKAHMAEGTDKVEFKIKFNHIIKTNEINYQNSKDLDDELDQIKSLLNNNIEQVLERNERINLLVNKTTQLNNMSTRFNVNSKKIKRSMWWDNIKFWALFIFIATVVVIAVSLQLFGH
ncbi:hypothetical protein WICPIJ_004344 [Wickerhamomyces pijperi]|uniref:V-SNARE coiled-coil homology domain-containing protein n=1 Tax=Wickerhamomyces pijperi TaxID=599730 RepID=A0A9P8TN03_WICPI|nr:hypothetical protein WICPIJ_004344 [Wickerhamomyces pijperi]